MSNKPSNSSSEDRFAKALMSVAGEGVDLSRVLEQIPVADRPRLGVVLSGLAEEVTKLRSAPTIISGLPEDTKKLAELLKLEEGYEGAAETQKVFQLLRLGENIPDINTVLGVFTPEMLVMAQSFQKPTLTLTSKGRSFNDLISAMDGHKTIRGQNDASVDVLFSQYAKRKQKYWGAHIIEGPSEIKAADFDDVEGLLMERIKNFDSAKKNKGFSGMDRWKYAHLMMQKLTNKDTLDIEQCTLLNEDPASYETRFMGANWCQVRRQVEFRWGDSGTSFRVGRFRRSVGGFIS